ncbi:MAG: hypothetical protein J0M12_13550 [Deltaproteobacteria bacterium]|nr:hypothetical protein [Deltaproteobacteria bacterium]
MEVSAANSAVTSNAASTRDDIKYLRSVLKPDKNGMVHEEQLFAGIVEERVKISLGSDVATKFHERFELAMSRIGKKSNVVENAVRRALKFLVKHDLISQKQAVKIHSEAFAAAQIDSNKEMLFDGNGGANDKTIATKEVNLAVNTAIDRLNAFDAGKVNSPERKMREVA